MSIVRARSSLRLWGHVSQVSDTLREGLERRLATAQSEWRLPSVSAGVFRDGEVVWQQALGVADHEGGEEATTAHAYRIGSITKTFTAVCILALRDAGELDLDASLRSYVPEVPPGPTIRQILSHSSGLQREPPGDIWETMVMPSREELLAGLEDAELVLRPGEQWHYSNLGFALLGEVVARRAATSWEAALQERVLDPLGLTRTGLHPDTPVASGYYVDPFCDVLHPEADPAVTETTSAAGWLWSTVADLARWGDLLANGADGVLATSTADEMARPVAFVDPDTWTVGWGLGVGLYRRGERVFCGHGGAMPGFLASLVVNRPTRIGAVALMNTSTGAMPDLLAVELAELALDQLPPRPPDRWAASRDTPSELSGVLGIWWTEGDQIVISHLGGRLQADLVHGVPGRKISSFEREADDTWRCVEGRERGELLRIVRDETGAVVKLSFATYPLTRDPQTFGL